MRVRRCTRALRATRAAGSARARAASTNRPRPSRSGARAACTRWADAARAPSPGRAARAVRRRDPSPGPPRNLKALRTLLDRSSRIRSHGLFCKV